MVTIMHIRYSVKAGYAAQNQEYIRNVMEELRSLNRADIQYSVFMKDDGKTFIHQPIFASTEARKVFEELAAFRKFQAELQESRLEVPPQVTHLTLVDASDDLFS